MMCPDGRMKLLFFAVGGFLQAWSSLLYSLCSLILELDCLTTLAAMSARFSKSGVGSAWFAPFGEVCCGVVLSYWLKLITYFCS